ncbi:MAG: CBS domain-containing protein [Candidatus Binatus sp.]|uniref:CBS domain-containing protein n=1 Tax=Candidatus Binatus sp. TaxID=2811406 RepID=UPI002720B52D|nr:CBS domain-containing protein [Candidatus Binatus sp.]MDO8432613.1 CBS domain-containing protein [Candidatus Binatus sp.]
MMQMLHVMTKHPETVRSGDMLLKAKEMMDAGKFRRLPVVDEGRVVGILTERDLREHAGYLDSTKVDAAMKAPVVSVDSKTSVEEAARLMLVHKIGGLPVVDGGKLVGVVTSSDMLRAFLNVVEATQKIVEH